MSSRQTRRSCGPISGVLDSKSADEKRPDYAYLVFEFWHAERALALQSEPGVGV
jgi:hypothetical protein